MSPQRARPLERSPFMNVHMSTCPHRDARLSRHTCVARLGHLRAQCRLAAAYRFDWCVFVPAVLGAPYARFVPCCCVMGRAAMQQSFRHFYQQSFAANAVSHPRPRPSGARTHARTHAPTHPRAHAHPHSAIMHTLSENPPVFESASATSSAHLPSVRPRARARA